MNRPLAGAELVGGVGAGESAHGAAGQAQFLRDCALAISPVEQFVDCSVAIASAVRVSVGGPGRLAGPGGLLQFGNRGRRGRLCGDVGGFAQVGGVAGDALVDGFAQVVPDVPSVS
ncbi:hypothetical protein ACWCQK_42320, partial [Streptomyces sp. NPDC002306]